VPNKKRVEGYFSGDVRGRQRGRRVAWLLAAIADRSKHGPGLVKSSSLTTFIGALRGDGKRYETRGQGLCRSLPLMKRCATLIPCQREV
ncbi:MAG: hypothetical protein KF876_11495, partial [Nitrospira sp.]|nr:hypothetical protein [Nitrospira sp.]